MNPQTTLLSDITIRTDINFLPPLDKDERAALQADIERTGRIRDPLTLWRDGEELILIDGHNRFEIASALGLIEAPAVFENFVDLEAVHSWIFDHQCARRNLGVFERIRLALLLEGPLAVSAAERKKASQFGAAADSQMSDGPAEQKGTVLQILAQKAGSSHDTVNKVRQIMKSGSPKLIEYVGLGEISINRAAQIALAHPYPDEETEQKMSVEKLICFGKSDEMELVGEHPEMFDGAGKKIYRIRKSFVQFAKKDNGKDDNQNFIVGGKYGKSGHVFTGITVRGIDGRVQVVGAGFLGQLGDSYEQPYQITTDIPDLLEEMRNLHDYLSVAADLMLAQNNFQKVNERVAVKKRRIKREVEAEAESEKKKKLDSEGKEIWRQARLDRIAYQICGIIANFPEEDQRRVAEICTTINSLMLEATPVKKLIKYIKYSIQKDAEGSEGGRVKPVILTEKQEKLGNQYIDFVKVMADAAVEWAKNAATGSTSVYISASLVASDSITATPAGTEHENPDKVTSTKAAKINAAKVETAKPTKAAPVSKKATKKLSKASKTNAKAAEKETEKPAEGKTAGPVVEAVAESPASVAATPTAIHEQFERALSAASVEQTELYASQYDATKKLIFDLVANRNASEKTAEEALTRALELISTDPIQFAVNSLTVEEKVQFDHLDKQRYEFVMNELSETEDTDPVSAAVEIIKGCLSTFREEDLEVAEESAAETNPEETAQSESGPESTDSSAPIETASIKSVVSTTTAEKPKTAKQLARQQEKELEAQKRENEINDKIKTIVQSFPEENQEKAVQILDTLTKNQIFNNDIPALTYVVKKELITP